MSLNSPIKLSFPQQKALFSWANIFAVMIVFAQVRMRNQSPFIRWQTVSAMAAIRFSSSWNWPVAAPLHSEKFDLMMFVVNFGRFEVSLLFRLWPQIVVLGSKSSQKGILKSNLNPRKNGSFCQILVSFSVILLIWYFLVCFYFFWCILIILGSHFQANFGAIWLHFVFVFSQFFGWSCPILL